MSKTLFPHTKLDWLIHKLQEEGGEGQELELCKALVSRGFFHGGGEPVCNEAHQLARRLLRDEDHAAEAHTLAGMALLGMGRPEAAQRHLEQALELDPERADLRLALGALHDEAGDAGQAVRQLEFACRLAPESWETHLFLGRALAALGRPQGNPRRLVERSQYHLVRALQLEPTPDLVPGLLKDIGISCLLVGKYREAEKFFVRLREHEEHENAASYFLGQVSYHLGKHHNAIQHYRKFLRVKPDDGKVLARMAMAWFALGEYPRAREACGQALVADPGNLQARHLLGCAFLEEGDPNEALKVFRETLKDNPQHMASYTELARVRRVGGDTPWLLQALQVEVGQYDRLPYGGAVEPRRITRQRIATVLEELRQVPADTVGPLLQTVHQTQDEGVRFQLWEAACQMAATAKAERVTERLASPGAHYSAELGMEALACAGVLPEPVLTGGLRLEESDLKRMAVERSGPAHDVVAHRQNLDAEREVARAYQAMLLLAIASRKSAAGRVLLKDWAESGDPDLATAALTGLVLYGDADAAQALQAVAARRGQQALVDRLLHLVTPRERRGEARQLSNAASTSCSTCGRSSGEVLHLMAGGKAVICDRCMVRIGQHRHSLPAPDDASCDLCGRTPFEVKGLYAHNGVNVCSHCLEQSLGLLEREEVDRFLAAW